MGTRWNSGDLFSALSSFICLPAKRQRNNNKENSKPDQCTQFRDEKKEAPRGSGPVEGRGFRRGLYPSLAPQPPCGQKTSITRKQTSIFTCKEVHRELPFNSTLHQLPRLSNMTEMSNQSAEASSSILEGGQEPKEAVLVTTLAGPVE